MKKLLYTYRPIMVFVMLCFALQVDAQKLSTQSKKAAGLYEKALSYYRARKVESAKAPLQQAIKKDPNFIEAHLLMSELYFEQKKYENQIEYLENVIEIDSTYSVFSYYNLGVASYEIKNFDQAIIYFQKYYHKTKNSKKKKEVDDWLKRIELAETAEEKPVSIHAKNLGPNVNSKYNEYWPSITADEQILVYTVLVDRDSAVSKHPYKMAISNLYHEDFFRSVKDETGEWSKREQLKPPLNSGSNEGAQALSMDGNWMFFTACGRSDSKGSCDLYFSYRTEYGWSEPKNLGAPVNTPYWESQPSFSSDGRTLYFISSRPGGEGGNDIWHATLLSIKPDGTPFFGRPVNLGPMVNTHHNEVSPFIHPDNSTLYFASEGWPGMGKADLFMSRMKAGEFVSEPVNLGVPINTEGDEVGLVVTASGKTAYFASEGTGDSYGGRDLYSFDMPKDIQPLPVSYIKGRVFDSKTRERLSASFELRDIFSGKLAAQAMSTDFSGEFLVCLPVDGSYALSVSKKGYLFYSDHFEMDSSASVNDPMVLDIYLKRIQVGEQIVLNNIFFETDSYELKNESEIELAKVLVFLNENEQTKIQVLGYTDNVGSAEYNQRLSKQRAQQVYQYLINKGIDVSRLSYKGEGMNNPVATNDTEEGRAKNRRTEMKIVE
ncbi:OmpA family protein [Labilibacter marinus]|uniref:OmpA family protein n=1 Tax=Labilibacter marinus TaxID=1477105 RepID=UPI001300E072|nr:OmpA family protein [Labilibacter marinus]